MSGSNPHAVVLVLFGLTLGCGQGQKADTPPRDTTPWLDTFDLKGCTLGTTGRNDYWILEPGYQIVLQDGAEGVVITVLESTEVVNGVETRVVEERESENGKLKEVSRNFFVICREHRDVFYFGEEVDDYKDGRIVGHGGAWRAGRDSAHAGLMMPGKPIVGFRHYQEVAPGIAMDRAEIVTSDCRIETPGGTFQNCLKVVETSPLESGRSQKVYAPGVGLVFDDGLKVVSYGRGAADRAPSPNGFTELEITPDEMPGDLLAKVRELHPGGTIKEVKRETHGGVRVLYAVEIMVDGKQHDVEITQEGEVIRNEAE